MMRFRPIHSSPACAVPQGAGCAFCRRPFSLFVRINGRILKLTPHVSATGEAVCQPCDQWSRNAQNKSREEIIQLVEDRWVAAMKERL